MFIKITSNNFRHKLSNIKLKGKSAKKLSEVNFIFVKLK